MWYEIAYVSNEENEGFNVTSSLEELTAAINRMISDFSVEEVEAELPFGWTYDRIRITYEGRTFCVVRDIPFNSLTLMEFKGGE